MLPLEGRTALVTGASRGLGRGIALVLAEQGADVCINYRSAQPAALEVASQIQDMGRKAFVVQADVGDESDVLRMFGEIREEFGRLDILVNNAGTTRPQDIFDTSLEDWDFIIRTNLQSCFLCSKVGMEMMREQKSGSIVNISSIVAKRGALFGHVHYAATKSGMLGMTRTLARTAAPFGITVNAVAPGLIETELLISTHGADGIGELAKDIPLGLGRPRDVGLAVGYLCGEGGRYITGTTLNINGGMYMS
jgi:3-oxoacyl-[acyl-carrier protein] reductase